MDNNEELTFAPPQRRQSLRDHALKELRRSLMNGELKAGQLYSAVNLAEQLQTSTTPVREALLDLSREGLFVAEKNRGFRVAEIDPKDITLLNQTRVLLEVPLLADVHANLTPEGLEELYSLALAVGNLTSEKERFDFVRLDRDFHLTLLRHAGNSFALEVIADFRNKSRLNFLRSTHNQADVEGSAREHFDLLDHLAKGEVEAAQTILRDHILGTHLSDWDG